MHLTVTSVESPLREARLAKGWTQADLSDQIFQRTGCLFSPADLSRIERGRSFPRTPEKIQSISKVLGVAVPDWQTFVARIKEEEANEKMGLGKSMSSR